MIRSAGRLFGLMVAALVGLSQGTVAIAHAEAHHQEGAHHQVGNPSGVPHGDHTAGDAENDRDDGDGGPTVASPDRDAAHQHAVLGPSLVGRDGGHASPVAPAPRTTLVTICRRERPTVLWPAWFARAGPSRSAPAQPRAPPVS